MSLEAEELRERAQGLWNKALDTAGGVAQDTRAWIQSEGTQARVRAFRQDAARVAAHVWRAVEGAAQRVAPSDDVWESPVDLDLNLRDSIRRTRKRAPANPPLPPPGPQRETPADPNARVLVGARNELTWYPQRKLLRIAEPSWTDEKGRHPGFAIDVRLDARRDRLAALFQGLEEARPSQPELPEARARRSERHKPEAAGQATDAPDETAFQGMELPYVIETGFNTFCWYRKARVLQVAHTKRLDDTGLMLSDTAMTLYVGELGDGARAFFTDILKALQ